MRPPASIDGVSASEAGWRRARVAPSLPEVHASIRIPLNAKPWRKMLAFLGPGLLVSVGYMDPGNWATDLTGGARFGYTLLSVVLISNFMAILLQHLALKLGVVTGRDLAQACRDHYSKPVAFTLWLLCEVAIAACDLAEVIGSAIALNLLFHLPLVIGVLITAADVMVILFMQHRGFRVLEILVATLILTIGGCFGYELLASGPSGSGMLGGLLPSTEIVANPEMLYIAIGILGATVMPHNLYLHSSIVQTRAFARDDGGKKMAVHYATIDSTLALLFAFFINAAILVLAAAAFHGKINQDEVGITDAYHLLPKFLGGTAAATLFAIALLCSGQNSTLTGTLAGQIVMEGFLSIRLRPWVRRLITRLVAIVPAVIVAAIAGERGMEKLLILSQVILSLQLSFAVIPLVLFTSDRRKMGAFANPLWMKGLAWVVTAVIVALNGYLLVATAMDSLKSKPEDTAHVPHHSAAAR
jgi:manganese transport protein